MTYRSESEALRARANSLEQDLQRQRAEVAEGRAAKAKARALEEELEAARAKLAKLERRRAPKRPGPSSSKLALAIGLGLVFLMAVGAASFLVISAPEEPPVSSVPVPALPTPPIKPARPAVSLPGRVETGPLNKTTIQRIIRRHLRQVKYCYERELLRKPKLEGKLVFSWTIGERGAVTAVKLKSSTMPTSSTPDCILRQIRRWRFPAPAKDPVEISYPFIFRTSD